ncbi:MAG: hypothetical protein H6702_12600 [Myxococcales bacterium]|nr:hypothetical protein [Myxococcales bacterium]
MTAPNGDALAALPDLLQIALPAAAFAGLVAIGVTVAIERLGGRVGGLLGTLPTTIVPASLGILAQAGPEGLRAAMDVTPLGMLLNALFLLVWRLLPPRLPAVGFGARLALTVTASLAVWLTGAVALVLGARAFVGAGGDSLWLSLAGVAVLAGVGVAATARARPAPRGQRPVRPLTLLLRGVFAASAIGAAVWVSAVGGGLAAGVVSVFPAIFLTTMVALWLAQGHAVQAGAVGPMMLGSTAVAGYALWARWLLPAWGPWGAVPTWLLAVGTATLPAWAWLRRRRA